MLQAEFDIADGKCADAHSTFPGSKGRTIGLDGESLDPRRGHGVGIGRDFEIARRLEIAAGEDLNPRPAEDKHHVACGNRLTTTFVAAAIRCDEVFAEALLELGSLARHDVAAIIADQRSLRARLGSDDTDDAADDALGAEDGDLRALRAASAISSASMASRPPMKSTVFAAS